MNNAFERNFKEGQWVYVVDYWGTNNEMEAFGVRAEILVVDEKNQTFGAVLYGDTYKKYSFKDYGRLIFDTLNEAIGAARQLPKPKTTVYQIIGNKVYKKLALGICEQYKNKNFDLVVRLNRGKDVSTKEIGHTLFLNESDAKQNKK